MSLVTVFVLNFFSDISVVTQTLLATMCMEYVFSNLLFSSSLYLWIYTVSFVDSIYFDHFFFFWGCAQEIKQCSLIVSFNIYYIHTYIHGKIDKGEYNWMRTDCNRDLEQENFFEWMLDRVLIFPPVHGKRQLEDYTVFNA